MKKTTHSSTFTNGKRLKLDQLRAALAKHPEGATPKMLAFDSSLNVNTVKSLLPEIPGIKKTLRGVYLVVNGVHAPLFHSVTVLQSWNFHNCILSSVLPMPPLRRIERIKAYGSIGTALNVSTDGKITFRCNSDIPCNLSSISLLFGLLAEVTFKETGAILTEKDVFISTIEFNQDYSNLRLDGVKCITIDSLLEQFKLYQKSTALRLEHKTKVSLGVSDVVDMLQASPGGLEVNMKLNEQAKTLSRLTAATESNAAMIDELIKALRVRQ